MNDFSRRLYFFAMALMQAVFLLPQYPSDFALRALHDLYPGWPFGGASPYSILWFFMSPLYWTQFPFKLWCLGLVVGMSFAYWKLYRKGKIGYGLILAWQIQNCVWWAFANTQNIAITLLAPLAFMGGTYVLFAFWPIIVKVPWGWSLNLQDVHWHCAFAWPGGWITPVKECTSFNRWGLDGGLIYTYVMILLWCVVPLAWGIYCRRKARRK